MANITIRDARLTDAEIAAELWWALATEMEKHSPTNKLKDKEEVIENTIKTYQSMILNAGYGVFFAEDEQGSIVGYIDYEIQHIDVMRLEQKLLIRQLYVRPPHRNNGVGSKLLDKIIETGDDMDIDYITVPVEWENTGAQKLYKNKGFEEKQLRLVKTM